MIIQKALYNSLLTHGDKVAIEENEITISYTELLDKANKVTGYLQEKKVLEGSYIGIQTQSITDMVSAMLGIMNARCVFVPMNEELPEKRLASMVAKLDLSYVLTDIDARISEVYENIPKINFNSIYSGSYNILLPEYDAEDALYVYFTSGSTGEPKGIIGKNKSLLQFLQWESKKFNITESDRFSQLISPYFDAFLRDVFTPLYCGATICVPPKEEDFFTTEKMVTWINAEEITIIHCVPSVFRIFNADNLTSEDYSSLRYVLLSGEKIAPVELKKWYGIFEDIIKLVNLYGTTETTMIRCCYIIKPSDVSKSKIPIGNPIDDTELLILDKNHKPCKSLMSGDVYISSPYLTKGYLKDERLTKEKFIVLNEGTSEERIAFKTGDIARRLINNTVELLGRNDRQVKINGIRIEIDEIENLLLEAPQIENAVVIKDTVSEEQLTVYYHVKEIFKNKSIRDKILQYLEENLPKYMVPSSLIEVDEFPLLPNGKIDFKTLALEGEKKVIKAPEGEYETRVLEVWKSILGDKAISVDESFQMAGGRSLALMRLIGKLYSEFGVRITLKDLFKNLTIQKQAQLISSLTKNNNEDVYAIRKVADKEYYNVSSSQKAIYYNYELNKEGIAYNMPMVWEILWDINADKITEVIEKVVQRHESLRTSFFIQDNNFVQKVQDVVTVKLEQKEIKKDVLDQEIETFIRPFNLNNPPLIRVGLFKTEDSHYLIVDLHHIAADGVSQQLLYKEFMTLYTNRELPPLTYTYKDYAEWEYEFRKQEDFAKLKDFWLHKFEDGVPKLNLFSSGKKENETGKEGEQIEFNIDKKAILQFTETLSKKGITTFTGFFGVLQLLLFKITGQNDMVIGITSSGRVQEEINDLVGTFVNMLPIRQAIDKEMSFVSHVSKLKEHLIEAMSKQLYSLIDIKAALNKRNSEQNNNMFDVLFNYQDMTKTDTFSDEFPINYYEMNTKSFNYPLELKVFEMLEVVSFKLKYITSYFNKKDAQAFADEFRQIVLQLVKNPDVAMHLHVEKKLQESQMIDEISFNF
ncbi:non-ribosomal peptide synthetase [Tenacibaculum sp. M341]|uniref:non-ribosomal peptide synthetase n=1 Tax=Tenacibaculum sp. M341 TaxID=2530339 RepID=UPI001052029C|nr:non-ribosomal peptide synthetase [Tenacibaculum sp. M341]TCI85722.1 amino acid adenylation domain-containing protein [Tenacibaculum sp. M341]